MNCTNKVKNKNYQSKNRKTGRIYSPNAHIYDRSVQARLQKVYHDTILRINMYGWYALCGG
jgi:hypothetical protein